MKMALSRLLVFLTCFTIMVSISIAQERAPHGLAYENQMAFSPSAYDFFHPNPQNQPCTGCSPLPMAAKVGTAAANTGEGAMEKNKSSVGGIIVIVLGFAVIVCLAMGAYRVMIMRRGANLGRDDFVKPEV